MKRIASALLLMTVTIALCGGCFWNKPYREIVRYDLDAPEQIAADGEVRFAVFRTLVPGGRNFSFRAADGGLSEEQYAAWAQSPEQMLQRYLMRAFERAPSPVAEKYYEVAATLLDFTMDPETGRAAVSLHCEVRGFSRGARTFTRSGTISASAPLAGKSGADAVRAMSDCARQIARNLSETIKE